MPLRVVVCVFPDNRLPVHATETVSDERTSVETSWPVEAREANPPHRLAFPAV
jgi:hypothetical protein